MTLVVNTPAVTAAVSHVMSARSALGPFARIAAYIPGAAEEGWSKIMPGSRYSGRGEGCGQEMSSGG